MFCSVIGHRLLGTKNDRRAADYIESHFKNCGMEVSCQRFNCPSWDHMNTTIHTSSGYEITPPEGGACMFSIPCDVTGEVINLKTLDELKRADIKGKICVMSGELAKAPMREDRNPILLLIEKKAPLALIITDTIEHGYQTKTIRDPKFRIPVCAVSRNSGAYLLEDKGKVTVKIEAHRYESFSRNIFASNSKKNERKIRVIAHYDTASDSPGAIDNGSGISILLETAEVIKEIDSSIPVEFIAFGGEEYAKAGSSEYERVYQDSINATEFVINIDAVGGYNWKSQIYLMGENENLNKAVCNQKDIAGGYHNIIFDNAIMTSDHEAFCKRGIPTVFFNDYPPENTTYDTNLDIPRFVCLERLEDITEIIIGTIIEAGS